MNQYVIATFYKFVNLPNYQQWRKPLFNLCQKLAIRGTLLLAHEGINGTISGQRKEVDEILTWLRKYPELDDLKPRESCAEMPPFQRLKVRLKKEIITLKMKDVDPKIEVGKYVEPKDWNQLISDPKVLLIDARNEYEIALGKFKRAINPQTESFRDFPEYVEKQLMFAREKPVALYCTGGIRCEKATALLCKKGFKKVYHLHGGILNYLENVARELSLWEGECFVFDDRVAVNHALEKGSWEICYACQQPINKEDRQSKHYTIGIQCPRCYHKLSAEKYASLLERQKQIDLARERGENHMGMEDLVLGRAYKASWNNLESSGNFS